MDETKPVLGLFNDEDELRDYIADRLELIEQNLSIIGREYQLENLDGAGGRIDILARDPYRHLLCIEVKRSNNSARATLNELSKYVSLLVTRERQTKETIRCVVISTHWEELRLPLSYFAKCAGVQVIALHALRDGDALALKRLRLIDFSSLPQLCPDMDLITFQTGESRDRSLKSIHARAECMPFVQMAAILFEPKKSSHAKVYPILVCVWRLSDGFQEKIENIIGRAIGECYPYAAPGWEPETDSMDWITTLGSAAPSDYTFEWTHGTSEKVAALLTDFDLVNIKRIGNWPKYHAIKDDTEILEAILAQSPIGGSGRANRYSFRMEARPSIEASWRLVVNAFLKFVSFDPIWHEKAQAFLNGEFDDNSVVKFVAHDVRHVLYLIHQARFRKDAKLSFFEIIVYKNTKITAGLLGEYSWDGRTCPASAERVIETVYGNVIWARIAMGSAVDHKRYDDAFLLHGFLPAFTWIEHGVAYVGDPEVRYSIQDFVKRNTEYCTSVANLLESVGPLPTAQTS
ncbi:DUF91 domain-containing protein [Methylobacterium sp. SD274]|uniref:endonuclease NucS domain-containing protein n=1 Tax=Methylobacterium sp. SD274 TaxID=2782009 RepID=UPI001A960D86|nr:endonuclease NucS domain-containing protein [Methylobacterium sp. SD274]MBO1022601.1 DUF91 domain-containing protein [Methylobacterium sp. SD274]